MPGDFPPEALARGRGCGRAAPLPAREDRRDIELFTIDPPSSMDLDQAVALDAPRRRLPGRLRDRRRRRLRAARRRARRRGAPARADPLPARRQRAAAPARALRGRGEPAARQATARPTLWTFDARRRTARAKLLDVAPRARAQPRAVRLRRRRGSTRTTSASRLLARDRRAPAGARARRAARSTCRSPSRRSSCVTAATRCAYRGPLPIEDGERADLAADGDGGRRS